MMDKRTREKAYEKAIEEYGEEAQVFVAIEEFSELIQVLCKILAGKNWKHENLITELADCRIMIEQLEYMLIEEPGNSEVKEKMTQKIEKLLKKIENAKQV